MKAIHHLFRRLRHVGPLTMRSSVVCHVPQVRTIASYCGVVAGVSLIGLSCETEAERVSVEQLLDLYEEVVKNMEILTDRMLSNLKDEVNTSGELSKEQLALKMSFEFESTLENVQNAVFRNNSVSKERIQETLSQLERGDFQDFSSEQAEQLNQFSNAIGRLRWKCTGSREPLIGNPNSRINKDDVLPLPQVLAFLQEFFPLVNMKMKQVLTQVSDLTGEERDREMAKRYLEASGALTEELCLEKQIDLVQLQKTLEYFQNDPMFQSALQQLIEQQQDKFKEWGVF